MTFLKKYKKDWTIILSSFVSVGAWIIIIFSAFAFLFFAPFYKTTHSYIVLTSLFILFSLSIFTLKEKNFSYISWGIIFFSSFFIIQNIPFSIELFFIPVVFFLMSLLSALIVQKKEHQSMNIWGYLFIGITAVVFFLHAYFYTQFEKNNVKMSPFEQSLFLLSEGSPEEILKTESGTKMMIDFYDLKTQEEISRLPEMIKEDPERFASFQKQARKMTHVFQENSYLYLFNSYFSFLTSK